MVCCLRKNQNLLILMNSNYHLDCHQGPVYRLHVFPIAVPALRERMPRGRDDEEFLAEHRYGGQIRALDRERQQPRVDPPGPDLGDGPIRRRDGQPHVEMGVDPAQVLQERREDIQTDRHAA
jgi:hypothetical protein